MDSVVALDEALTDLVRLVSAVGDDWDAPTPCPAWSVGDVLDHVLAVTDKFTRFAAGRTDAPRGRRVPIVDRRIALDAVVAASRAAWTDVDLRRICRLPFGDFPADRAAAINAADVLVHTWDIARGAGVDYTMPPALVPDALAVVTSLAAADVDGEHYAPPPAEPHGRGADALLIASGRSPSWPG
ncbi:MAG: TIGR03086 family metal-binding protein [Gordonia sp. (in: high G+C Gram-positive bacteria)]|uniref:TIGR03086 family metal-binding protein n=1 Tax=Gordonia sp. (in: high G+C Gram-positive bacteria) TaxID=84139 RepID=UPI0039E4E42E